MAEIIDPAIVANGKIGAILLNDLIHIVAESIEKLVHDLGDHPRIRMHDYRAVIAIFIAQGLFHISYPLKHSTAAA